MEQEANNSILRKGSFMDRNLGDVIEEIQQFSQSHQLNTELQCIKESLICAAPEMIPFWWQETASCLQSNIPDLNQDWQKTVFKIFTTQDFE